MGSSLGTLASRAQLGGQWLEGGGRLTPVNSIGQVLVGLCTVAVRQEGRVGLVLRHTWVCTP